jgi:hypothetical protein
MGGLAFSSAGLVLSVLTLRFWNPLPYKSGNDLTPATIYDKLLQFDENLLQLWLSWDLAERME